MPPETNRALPQGPPGIGRKRPSPPGLALASTPQAGSSFASRQCCPFVRCLEEEKRKTIQRSARLLPMKLLAAPAIALLLSACASAGAAVATQSQLDARPGSSLAADCAAAVDRSDRHRERVAELAGCYEPVGDPIKSLPTLLSGVAPAIPGRWCDLLRRVPSSSRAPQSGRASPRGPGGRQCRRHAA